LERNLVVKTVLITGTSSGIGRETALYFASKGWNVVATMRNPESRQTDLKGKDNIDCVHLDVLDMESIRKAVRFAKDKHGSIDVIVSNAGYATLGPFEASMEPSSSEDWLFDVKRPQPLDPTFFLRRLLRLRRARSG
jgi:NAD(P)-dependent dehydrogenase (short-subunit alcohol dehydrogenase family)